MWCCDKHDPSNRWLGLEIDAAANSNNTQVISAASSRIRVFVIPTDEEQVIAEEAVAILCAVRDKSTDAYGSVPERATCERDVIDAR